MAGPLPKSWFDRDVVELARALVGAHLLIDGVGGMIVETEAYAPDDPASHSFGGRTPRNSVMFGPSGHVYVYRSYGIHWCLNIVAGAPGSAVLIRALAPECGLERMRERRGLDVERLLCAGPGRLCQALGVTVKHNGLPVFALPFEVHAPEIRPALAEGPRIGITRAVDLPWRFGLAGSPFLSRPFRLNKKGATRRPRP